MDEEEFEIPVRTSGRRSTLPTLLPSELPGQEPVAVSAVARNNNNVSKKGGKNVARQGNVLLQNRMAQVNSPTPKVENNKRRRKKSLPDEKQLPNQIPIMSREEVSVLSALKREEEERLAEEAQRYKANPLLYVFNPAVKEWLYGQQLLMMVVVFNLGMAIMFYKLLN